MRLLHHRDGRPAGTLTSEELAGLYRWSAGPGETKVRSNFVSTLDGSVQGLDGRSGSINTESDHLVFALHRALADVILVGAGTVRGEGYRAVDLQPWQRSLRAAEGLAPYPTLAVVSSSLRLDPSIADPPYEHGRVIVLTGADHADSELDRFRERGVDVRQAPGGQVDPGWLLAELAQLGLHRVLCEGGPTVHRDLLAAGLLDELSLTLAPNAVGGVGHRSTAGAALPARADFELTFVLLGDDQTLFASYRRPH
ncbi:MAG TPA: dihydrofolate reductase family protein [Microlunatus sp.]|nr:dihydrofolate reductase family protein [Microlunatus sp.]